MLEFILIFLACCATALALFPLPGPTVDEPRSDTRVIVHGRVIVLSDREAARLDARIRAAKRIR